MSLPCFAMTTTYKKHGSKQDDNMKVYDEEEKCWAKTLKDRLLKEIDEQCKDARSKTSTIRPAQERTVTGSHHRRTSGRLSTGECHRNTR